MPAIEKTTGKLRVKMCNDFTSNAPYPLAESQETGMIFRHVTGSLLKPSLKIVSHVFGFT